MLFLKFFASKRASLAFYSLFLVIAMVAVLQLNERIVSELSYDRHIRDADEVYRVQLTISPPQADEPIRLAGAPWAAIAVVRSALGPSTKITYVEKLAGAFDVGASQVPADLLRVDQHFLDVLPLPLQEGSTETALAATDAIVLTPEDAQRLLGVDRGVLGKSVTYNGEAKTVTGLLARSHRASHLPPLSLARSPTQLAAAADNSMFRVNGYVYVRTPAPNVEHALNAALDSVVGRLNIGGRDLAASQMLRFAARPLVRLHIDTRAQGELTPTVQPSDLAALALCSGVFALVASVAFGLAYSGLATYRLREWGLSSLFGRSRRRIVAGVAIEIAGWIAVLGVGAFGILRLLNLAGLVDRSGGGLADTGPVALLSMSLFAVPLMVVIVASAGAALSRPTVELLTRFTPSSSRLSWMGHLLLALVMLPAAGAIVFAVTIASQNAYVQQLGIGFKTREVVLLRNLYQHGLEAVDRERLTLFAKSHLGAVAAGQTSLVPGEEPHTSASAQMNAGAGSSAEVKVDVVGGDDSALTALGANFIAGRPLSRAEAADALTRSGPENGAAVVNESVLRAIGIRDPESIIDKSIRLADGERQLQLRIVGVVRDLLYLGARRAPNPTIYVLDTAAARHIVLRVAAGVNAQSVGEQAVQALHELGITLNGAPVVETAAVAMERLSRQERSTLRAIRLFAFVAGLFAIVAALGAVLQVLLQRRQDIALRRTLGAPVLAIAGPLIRGWMTPVLLASIMGGGGAFVMGRRWLEQFAFRSTPGLGTVFLVGSLTLVAFVALVYAATAAFCRSPALYRDLYR